METKIKGTSYGVVGLFKRQNNFKMEELDGLFGMLRPGSPVPLSHPFNLGALMTYFPPPTRFRPGHW